MKNKLNKFLIAACLLFIFSFLLAGSTVNAAVQQSVEVRIYSFFETHRSKLIGSYFSNKSDCNVTFYSLYDSLASKRFLSIVETLETLGVVFVKSCIPCESESHVTKDEALMIFASPLIGFFKEARLTAITAWITDYKVLDQALAINTEADLKVFTAIGTYSLTDEGVRTRLEELFGKEKSSDIETNPLNLVSPILALALVDSVNPCTFAVFTALLLMPLYSLGRIKAVAVGGSFILAIFIGYYALGLGLIQVLVSVQSVGKVVAVVGLAMGAFSIAFGLMPKFKSPVPKPLRKFIELYLNKSYTSSLASFALGLAATFILLPCSSGPYIVGLGLLSIVNNPIHAYFLLALYNVVFILPLIIILIALVASKSLIRKIKTFRSSRLGVMELISGIILVLVCIYILLT